MSGFVTLDLQDRCSESREALRGLRKNGGSERKIIEQFHEHFKGFSDSRSRFGKLIFLTFKLSRKAKVAFGFF